MNWKYNVMKAIMIGNEYKFELNVGSKFYLIYAHQADTILDWVALKVKELHPELVGDRWVSYVNVTHLLCKQQGLITSVGHDTGTYFRIHKARFKRALKRAVMHSFNKS